MLNKFAFFKFCFTTFKFQYLSIDLSFTYEESAIYFHLLFSNQKKKAEDPKSGGKPLPANKGKFSNFRDNKDTDAKAGESSTSDHELLHGRLSQLEKLQYQLTRQVRVVMPSLHCLFLNFLSISFFSY